MYHIYNLDLRRATLVSISAASAEDPRLSWTLAYYGADRVTFIASAASPMEESQIWVPEIEFEGAMSTFNMRARR